MLPIRNTNIPNNCIWVNNAVNLKQTKLRGNKHGFTFEQPNACLRSNCARTATYLDTDNIMLKNYPPTQTKAWQKLTDHYKTLAPVHLRELFAQDAQRFEKFTLQFEDMLFDLSKNRVTEETLELLVALAEEMELPSAIESLFGGDKINEIGRAHV